MKKTTKIIIQTLWLIGFIPFLCLAQTQKSYEHDTLSIKYTKEEGRITGPYTSFYKNGNKKAEGQFVNSLRTGKWILWDSLGNKRMERYYEHPLVFKQLHPPIPQEGPIPLLAKPIYKIVYNKFGYIEYYPAVERAVLFSKRIWRDVEKKDNPILFNDKIKQILINHQGDFFRNYREKLTEEAVDSIKSYLVNYELVSFKVKEDWLFDMDRMTMECRIITISPVVKIDNEAKALFWVNYSELRAAFAQIQLPKKVYPDHVKTLEDYFFYRFYKSTIYKESNPFDKYIKDYKEGKEIEKEAERIELKLIEAEHNIWLEFTTPK